MATIRQHNFSVSLSHMIWHLICWTSIAKKCSFCIPTLSFQFCSWTEDMMTGVIIQFQYWSRATCKFSSLSMHPSSPVQNIIAVCHLCLCTLETGYWKNKNIKIWTLNNGSYYCKNWNTVFLQLLLTGPILVLGMTNSVDHDQTHKYDLGLSVCSDLFLQHIEASFYLHYIH